MAKHNLSPYRWWVLVLLTLGTIINYLDRIALGFLSPLIRKDLTLDDTAYGWVTWAFQIAYTVGFLGMGKLVDRYGTRFGYAFAATWWSAAAVMTVGARTPFQLAGVRGLLGLGEAGNFPAAIKSVSEWFSIKDRAFATGIFNAGTNVANMIGPALFAALSAAYGWRSCFSIVGSIGFVWAAAWWFTYRLPRHDEVEDDAASPNAPASMGWGQVAGFRETWGFALGKFFSDPVWWFYLFWLPPYLYDVRGLKMDDVKWILPFIYLVADVGSVAGGWLSGFFIRRGWSASKARKFTMLLCACCPPIAALGVLADNLYVMVGLFGLATAAHQGWSANLYTTVSDVFPKPAVASVTGIGGFAGGLSGSIFSALIPGYVVPVLGYKALFLTMGFFYFIGLFFLHKFRGELRPLRAGR